MKKDELELLLGPEEIQARVAELAGEIAQNLGDAEPVLLGVLKGAFIFLSDLARNLPLSAEVDFIRLSSYGSESQSSGRVTVTKDCECDLKGRPVLIVEDIVDTGLTLKWLKDHLKAKGAGPVFTCALIDKPERREVELDLDYVGFKVPQGFLVGYGLDYDERYRCLPGIYEVKL